MAPNDLSWALEPVSRSPQSRWSGLAAGILWVIMATALGLAIWIVPAEKPDRETSASEHPETLSAPDFPLSPKPVVATIRLPAPPPPPSTTAVPATVSRSLPPRTVKPLQMSPATPTAAIPEALPTITPMEPKPSPSSPTRSPRTAEPEPARLKPLIARVEEQHPEPAPVAEELSEPVREASKEVEQSKPRPANTAETEPGHDTNAEPVIQPVAETTKTGRVLLRMLEHGSGPHIEIAWPEREFRRERLFRLLQDCFGMRVAYLDNAGQLFVDEGRRGQSWVPNVDRYSGFLRQPSGPVTDAEMRALRKISNYHVGRSVGTPVRLFSRRADAVLLGGLSRLAGDAYGAATTVTARYEFDNGYFRVTHVRIDGNAVPGVIDLTPLAPTCTRGI